MTAADADWLDLRVPVDDAAKQQSLHLLDHAVRVLTPASADAAPASADAAPTDALSPGAAPPDGDHEPLLVIDIGAGTGNSARWFDDRLRERMPGRELDWVFIDADQASLDQAVRTMPKASAICAQISELPALTADLLNTAEAGTAGSPASGNGESGAPRLLLTCSAVLDVLTRSDLETISDTLVRFRGIGLFLLSITGGWTLDPPHQHDTILNDAFTAHQHRDGRLGCDAPEALARLAADREATITSGQSPWLLHAPHDHEFLTRFLSERIDAAIGASPHLAQTGRDWLSARCSRLRTGLSVRVDHADLLIDASGTHRP